ncbi:hypothetical protein ACE01N_11380 [Saccharicrinis sp. FJH2]|uniref:hypothetical protein n=1 Tax=Saccharicrinis sp. FJH65 TaxID=3344659 RepID=UPI0035F35063
MDRSALLKLIHKDINELQLLLEGMEGYGDIPEPIIKLAKSKAEQLKDNIDILPGEVRVAIHEPAEPDIEIVIEEKPKLEVKEVEEEPEPKPVVEEEPEEKEPEIKTEPVAVEETVTEIQDQSGIINESEEEPVATEPETIIEVEEEVSKVETEEEGESKVVTTKKKTVTVLGETIEAGEKVIDRIKKDISGSISARLEGSPIADLKRVININDRFMFQKELFNNDRDLFFKSLDDLNTLDSFDSALEYMVQHFDWDFEDETTGRFVSLVNRRYK